MRQNIFICLIVFGILWLINDSTSFLGNLENATLDQRMRYREQSQPKPHDSLMFVGVDEDSLKAFGQHPFNRAYHGVIMMGLNWQLNFVDDQPMPQPAAPRGYTPKVVGWDYLFTEPNPEQDQWFAYGCGLARVNEPFDIILGAFTEEGGTVLPPTTPEGQTPKQALTNIKHPQGIEALPADPAAKFPIQAMAPFTKFGFVNAEPGPDGLIRRLPLIVRIGDYCYPSLSFEMLLSYWDVAYENVEIYPGKYIKIAGTDPLTQEAVTRKIPIDERGYFTVNYRYEYHREEGRALPYYKLYENVETNDFEDAEETLRKLENKIIMIGPVAAGIGDIDPSPLDPQSPRVNVHMNALDNILKGDYLRKASFPLVLAIAAFISILASRILETRDIFWFAGIVVGVIILYTFVSFQVFSTSSMHIPLVVPLLGFIIHQSILLGQKLYQEQKHKKEIQGMFGSYVSPELVNRMIENNEEPKLGGDEVEITAFFSDIASFSSFSEVLTSTQLVDIMNEYLSAMTDTLDEHGGTLDKYIGDAIVAMYGAPIWMEDHAHRAAITAARCQSKQHELREKWIAEGEKWPNLVHFMKTRIGLNTGMATVGNMGSHKRFNYTMMGDTVNLAARSESGAKSYGVFTMVTESVVESSRKHGDDIIYRFLDKIVVKGRSQPVSMYELVCLKDELSNDITKCIDTYNEGIEHYLAQRWDKAIAAFEASSKLEVWKPEGDMPGINTNPSLLLIDRCHAYKENPPGDGWDGVFIMTTK